MNVIEYAKNRLNDSANNRYEHMYWFAFYEGAIAQKQEYELQEMREKEIMPKYSIRCTMCDNDINVFDKFIQVGNDIICEHCVDSLWEELDPEGDAADDWYDDYRNGDL